MNIRFTTGIIVLLLGTTLLAGPAAAAYYPKLHPTAETAIPDADLPPAPTGISEVLAAMDIYLEGCIPLNEAWDRHFIPFRGTDSAEGGMDVFQLAPAAATEPMLRADYTGSYRPVYLGFGHRFDKYNDWTSYDEVFTFFSEDGAVRILDSFQLHLQYSTGIFAVDLDLDGRLDLVCPSTAGVSASGLIEIVTINSDGTIIGFSSDDGPLVIDSAYGKCELQDFNGDGRWELETYHTYRYDGPDTDFFIALYEYNPATGRFQDVLGAYPEQYEDYQAFYRALSSQLTAYIADPQSFVTPDGTGCRIFDKWHPLEGWTELDRIAVFNYITGWDVANLSGTTD